MQVRCYFDYTCQYCYRALHWLDTVAAETHDLDIDWVTFSLKEANRDRDTPSPFDDNEISSLSVLALCLGHAARGADFNRYHHATFDAMHGDGRRIREEDLLALASDAGVDVDAFNDDRARWLAAVAREHHDGVARWRVFGTPTYIIEDDEAAFIKLSSAPANPSEAVAMWHSVCTLAMCHPDTIEIKRPGG
jgi:predicted DsbA family dithiol-disulfide isomerase